MGARIITLLLLLIPSLCFGQEQVARLSIPFVAGGTSDILGHCDDATHDGAGGTVLACEDFDGSSLCAATYSSTCRQSYTLSLNGTIDFDNAAAPAPLQGTYSTRSVASGTLENMVKFSYSAGDNIYVFAKINIDSLGTASTSRPIMYIQNSSNSSLCGFDVNASGVWAGYDGGNILTGTNSPSADTTYYVWLEYEIGTGANAKCRFYQATTTTKPSAEFSGGGGPGVTQGSQLLLISAQTTNVVFDYIRVNSSAFGDAPN